MSDKQRTAKKTARMLLLLHLKDAGVLDDLSFAEVGRILDVSRSTILRDMQDLPIVEAEYRRLMATQPWVQRELTVDEFAARIEAAPETVRCLIRDGLLTASKGAGPGRGGQWYIPVTELDWWLRPKK